MTRLLPAGMMDMLRGSASGVSMTFNVWYNQKLVIQDVPTKSWSMAWDDTRAIKGQTTLDVLDSAGDLLAWSYDEPLSVGGGMIQSILNVGPYSCALGFQRIVRVQPKESWRLYKPGGVKTWVSGTHQIAIQADDLTTMVSSNVFLAPETPAAGQGVFAEIRRVVRPYMDVIIDPALTDRTVPTTVVYSGDRMVTVQALCDAISAGHRVTGGGQLYIYAKQSTPSWTVFGDSNDANLVDTTRSSVYAGLYNGVVSRNVLPSGQELQGFAYIAGGPLAWGGPHGHVLYQHNAPFATDQAGINSDAQSMLNTVVRKRAASIPITTTLNPGLETGDMIQVMFPITNGSEQPLNGYVSQMTMSGSGGVNATMAVTYDVADADIAVIGALNQKLKG